MLLACVSVRVESPRALKVVLLFSFLREGKRADGLAFFQQRLHLCWVILHRDGVNIPNLHIPEDVKVVAGSSGRGHPRRHESVTKAMRAELLEPVAQAQGGSQHIHTKLSDGKVLRQRLVCSSGVDQVPCPLDHLPGVWHYWSTSQPEVLVGLSTYPQLKPVLKINKSLTDNVE